MYGEWSSLLGNEVGSCSNERCSVLEKLPSGSAKEVVGPVARHIVSSLGISHSPTVSNLNTDAEVEWALQVICYGLSLNLSEHEIIKDCVNIYCEWLSCLSPTPKISVPTPITDRPNFYFRKMIAHLYHLFIPRKGEGEELVSRQALLCHRVLRTLSTVLKSSSSLNLPFSSSSSSSTLIPSSSSLNLPYSSSHIPSSQNSTSQIPSSSSANNFSSQIPSSNNSSSLLIEPETSSAVLLFLISLNDALLSPPSSPLDAGEQLCERTLNTLFDIWLLFAASPSAFPGPSLWKTLGEGVRRWRHRGSVVESWRGVVKGLGARVCGVIYQGREGGKGVDDEGSMIPREMSNESIVQTWFRFLHILGNPVELTQPTIISQTQSFLQYAIASKEVVDPCQHPCLSVLPTIFHNAVRGLSDITNILLGISPPPALQLEKLAIVEASFLTAQSSQSGDPPASSPIPPMRRLAKSFSAAQSNVQKGLPRPSLLGTSTTKSSKSDKNDKSEKHDKSDKFDKSDKSERNSFSGTNLTSASSISSSGSPSLSSLSSICVNNTPMSTPAIQRPSVNSLLNLLGPWLFDSAMISSDGGKFDWERRRASRGSVPGALPETIDIPNGLTIDKFYLGRSEALGTLCRILSTKKTGEEIHPTYLARFYIALRRGLKDSSPEVLNSVLVNSSNLLSIDLDGISMLVPYFIYALESIFSIKDVNTRREIRRPGILLLLSLLPLPLHFKTLGIKDLNDRFDKGGSQQGLNFLQLKPRVANLLMSALQSETDSSNIQLILGGLVMFVLDIATYEEADKSGSALGIDSPALSTTPTNLMSSESLSMRSGSEHSVSFDEHMMNRSDSAHFDSAHALFARAIYIVCHRLITTWKTDIPVSIAALELLGAMARAKIHNQDGVECRRVVKWICDFISLQSSRPPPSHSRDLHSSILSAFSTLCLWLSHHPSILDDKETLLILFETVEYGISGTKSSGKGNIGKGDKELKPVSMRVHDAAEGLLGLIFEKVGSGNLSSNTSVIDERVLLAQHSLNLNSELAVNRNEILKRFRYFVTDSKILIGILEGPLDDEPDPLPTVSVLLRSGTGLSSWNFKYRYQGRSLGKPTRVRIDPGRPLANNNIGNFNETKFRYWPEQVDNITFCKADRAIPSVDELELSYEQSRLSLLVEAQLREEERVGLAIAKEFEENYEEFKKCTEAYAPPPPSTKEYQTGRLLLANLGFIAPEDRMKTDGGRKLESIDANQLDFFDDLDALDSTSCRTCDTVFIFYVKSGQKTAQEILSNVTSKNANRAHFVEFLLSLGWPVKIGTHSGWTGCPSTSWRKNFNPTPNNEFNAESAPTISAKNLNKSPNSSASISSKNISVFNGENEVLYWADVSAEIAFIVPSTKTNIEVCSNSVNNSEKIEKNELNAQISFDESRGKNKNYESKTFVIWLESFEDHLNFPTSELMEGKIGPEPSLLIFIHEMKNGLFRIHLQGESLRLGLPIPLVDGLVVSRRILGNLVRQTSLNMGRRKRLDIDSYHPPYVRRRLKIEEISKKYSKKMEMPEFYTSLFLPPNYVNEEETAGAKTEINMKEIMKGKGTKV